MHSMRPCACDGVCHDLVACPCNVSFKLQAWALESAWKHAVRDVCTVRSLRSGTTVVRLVLNTPNLTYSPPRRAKHHTRTRTVYAEAQQSAADPGTERLALSPAPAGTVTGPFASVSKRARALHRVASARATSGACRTAGEGSSWPAPWRTCASCSTQPLRTPRPGPSPPSHTCAGNASGCDPACCACCREHSDKRAGERSA